MAKVTWQDYLKLIPNYKSSPTKFWLKDDGDSAIIRFGIDDINELKSYRVHSVFINGKYQDVECPRTDDNDDISLCPYCSSHFTPSYKIYIPLLQYELGDDGIWIAKPKIWDQRYSFKETLKFNQENYGTLKDRVFKVIKKAPVGGKTEYILMIPNTTLYKPECFENKDFSCFNDFSVYNYILMKKDKINQITEETGEDK